MPDLKTVSRSRCVMTEIVLPNDTNGMGNLMGGHLMYLMDKCAAISAQRHANIVCVTAAVDSVEFQAPIRQSEVVILESWVNRAFRSSMEVELIVMAENPREQTLRQCSRAFFTFVALGNDGKPVPIPPIHPVTDEEHKRHEQAARRREARLVFAGRLKLEDAKHIKEDLLEAVTRNRQDAR
ncbi:MAG: acyl-CoA thioesterase [Rhodothermales bacterium]